MVWRRRRSRHSPCWPLTHSLATLSALTIVLLPLRWSRSSPPPPSSPSASFSPHPCPPPPCYLLLSSYLSYPIPPIPLPPLPPLTPAPSPPLINSSHMPTETHSQPIAAAYHNSRPLPRPSGPTWPHPNPQRRTHAFKEAAVSPGRLIPPSRALCAPVSLAMQHVGV